MAGRTIWFFCGHSDGSLHGRRTLAFAHPRGGFEMVDADVVVETVRRHASTLRMIVLNGCKSLHLAMRLVDAGIPAVACWESLVNDEAAFWFGLSFSRALATGRSIRSSYSTAVSTLLTITEEGYADGGLPGRVQKFELVDPEASGADLATGRLPSPPPPLPPSTTVSAAAAPAPPGGRAGASRPAFPGYYAPSPHRTSSTFPRCRAATSREETSRRRCSPASCAPREAKEAEAE